MIQDGTEQRMEQRMEQRTRSNPRLSARGRRHSVPALAAAAVLVISSAAAASGAEDVPGLATIDLGEMQSIVAEVESVAALAAN